MSRKSLLQIIQQVAGELSQPVPSEALASLDRTVRQLVALVRAACDELLDAHDWQVLRTKATITTDAGSSTYPLPADYHRMVNDTMWDRTDDVPVAALPPLQWATLDELSDCDTYRFRIAGDSVQLFPEPSTGDILTYEYISGNYVSAAGSTSRKPDFENDSDVPVFSSRLVINFVKLKFLQEQGLDTRSAAENFNMSWTTAVSNDRPSSVVSLAGGGDGVFIGRDNVPSRNWGQ